MSGPAFMDLDLRLREGSAASRASLGRVIADHDTGEFGGRCPSCGWQATRKAGCPSAVIARSLRDQRALPAWLAHLTVPGIPDPRPSRDTQRDAEDALPGLFSAPARARRST